MQTGIAQLQGLGKASHVKTAQGRRVPHDWHAPQITHWSQGIWLHCGGLKKSKVGRFEGRKEALEGSDGKLVGEHQIENSSA